MNKNILDELWHSLCQPIRNEEERIQEWYLIYKLKKENEPFFKEFYNEALKIRK